MEEGDWIDMTGILLITAEGTVAEGGVAADAEDRSAKTGHGTDHEAKGAAEQDTEVAHDDRAEHTGLAEESPANNAKHAVVAERASLATRTSPEATTTTAEDVVRASVEEANETVRGPTGADTDDGAHAAELEVALLAVSAPAREAHTEEAGAAQIVPPPAAGAEAEV
jgi:hypothetical protein